MLKRYSIAREPKADCRKNETNRLAVEDEFVGVELVDDVDAAATNDEVDLEIGDDEI